MAKILKRCVLFYLLLTTYCMLSYAYPPGWSDDILLTPEDAKGRVDPDVAIDSFNCVWAAWDSATWINGTAEILYSKRDSLGSCLISETDVSNNPTFSLYPRIAVDGSDNVHFIWRDVTPQGFGIWHAKLRNDGAVLVPAHVAVNGAGGGASTLLPGMAINKYNELYIIWDEHPAGYNQMNFTRLDSMGNPIIDKIQVSLSGVNAYWPGIGVDSFANAHMVYRSDSGFMDRFTYTKLDRDGNVLISNRFYGTGLLPTIIADRRQNMHIVYANPSGPGMSVEYLKLDQHGDVLVGPETLSVHEANNYPHMAMDSLQYLHAVWEAEVFYTFRIIYTKLDTSGTIVIPAMEIVNPPYTNGAGSPRIAVDVSNRLHLVWVDGRMDPGVTTDIFYKRGENEPGIAELNEHILEAMSLTVQPNPFTHSTTIRCIIETNQDISGVAGRSSANQKPEISIHDVAGRLVRIYHTGSSIPNPGSEVVWDGTDNYGNCLPTGVYLVRLEHNGQLRMHKVVKLE
jgi:hypothetical protein